MRKIILSILTIIIASSLSAQKFEVGLNGGIGFNSAPSVQTGLNSYNYSEKSSTLSPAGSLKVLYNKSKWQLGVEIAYTPLAYRYYIPIEQVTMNGGSFQQVGSQETKVTLSKPALPLKCIINKTFSFGKIQPYAGLSAGYVFVTNSSIPSHDFYYLNTKFNSPSGDGQTFGLRAGCVYFITRHLGLNAEVSGDYLNLNIGRLHYNLFYFPATFGIRYKL